jgi:hypothetical protein
LCNDPSIIGHASRVSFGFGDGCSGSGEICLVALSSVIPIDRHLQPAQPIEAW